MIEKTFVAACREHFGFKPNQTPVQFLHEIKELTPKDRADLSAEFEKIGIKIILAA